MKAKVVIISLRFNPAFLQSLISYAKTFDELGHEVWLLVAPGYARFSELAAVAPILEYTGGRRADLSWTHALFLNPAIENRKLAESLKERRTRILYLYHEPWQMSFSWLRDEGILATLKHTAAHRLTVPVLKLSDMVILASRFGQSQYEKSDIRYNRNHVFIPLLFDDEISEGLEQIIQRKKYFAFIGGLTRSHGFDQFLSFMRHAFRTEMGVRFMIASMCPLPEGIVNDPVIRSNVDKLEIRCGRPLNTEEMNRCYSESFCIWNLYRRSTQSGVLPKAMMFGTPSIASHAGSYPEFIVDGVNGRFALGNDVESIARAVDHIRSDTSAYAKGCRLCFSETFYYRSQLKRVAGIL